MAQDWEPGTQYNYGDVVCYNGHEYKIIQPHRSQGDWTPDVTPALWGRMQDHHGGGGHHGGQQQQQHPPPGGANYGADQSTNDPNKKWNEHTQQTVEIHDHEKEKNWYDIPPERRKEIEIGGGLLAGAAALAGGYMAYNHHQKGEEDKKADAWGLQNWLSDAQARAQRFRQNGPEGPVSWVLTNGKNIPNGAIVGGRDTNGDDLWIARAYCQGGVHPGKAFHNSRKGAVTSYGGKEVEVDTYEVLVGNQQAVRWVGQRGHLNLNALGGQPVEGGRDQDGSILYVARAPYKDGTHPGKISDKLKGACIAYGDDEVLVETYEVLVYN